MTAFTDNVYNQTIIAATAKEDVITSIIGGTDSKGGIHTAQDMGSPGVMLQLEKASMGQTTAYAAGGAILKAQKDAADALAQKV